MVRTVRAPESAAQPLARWRLTIRGTVQGVGFRPFVYRLATELGLAGFVRNDAAGVVLEVEGRPDVLAALARRVAEESPPLAVVEGVSCVTLSPNGLEGFRIDQSRADGGARVPISPDVATCDDCLAEIRDPAARRWRYPFTNCTNCGPRYTIVTAVPYDRPATTMAGFPMCPACRSEYEDPADRRFHAQPIACPACGPRLRLLSPLGEEQAEGDAALLGTITLLRRGAVVAVKGIGGYHLAVDAASEAGVEALRRRKVREDKPFAVMVPDLAAAERLVSLDGPARALLAGRERPIVLAERRPDAPVARAVAPGLAELGVFLPYTPLHHLLLEGTGCPLVLTSGNRSDEPIVFRDEDVVERLGPLVEGILSHNRPIHVRCDDSVARATPSGLQLQRRARGYAPAPLALPRPAARAVLALGAELKSTVALTVGDAVVASQHLGDLEHLEAWEAFRQAVDHLVAIYGIGPSLLAHDLHPEYLSTKFAEERAAVSGEQLFPVQHHHAHVASCLVDAGETGPVVGVAFDGLGYGVDGTLWGGELLVCDLDGFRRAGHLLGVPMPGGVAAVREPWRMALAWSLVAGGVELAGLAAERFEPGWGALVRPTGAGRFPFTSSVGRLFDATAALVGLRRRVSYEGQAAIELEMAARTRSAGTARHYEVAVELGDEVLLDPRGLVAAVVADSRAGVDTAAIARGFHEALAAASAAAAAEVASRAGLGTVALTGGVFQNVLLGEILGSRLEQLGLRVLRHRRIPPNDGGISIGQAAIAATATERPAACSDDRRRQLRPMSRR